MAKIKTSDLVAVEKALNVEVKYLGALAWFTISDCLITRNQLAERLLLAGLEERYLPGELNIRDAFRRACHAGERKGLPAGENFKNILVRHVKSTGSMIAQVVREVVDAKNVRLSYTPVIELELIGENITIRELVSLPPEEIAAEKEAAQAIAARFQVVKNHYEGYHIRDLVMRVLRDMDPVAVRPSGGVYFVPQAHDEKLQSLKAFVSGLKDFSVATGYETTMWSIPVIDVEEHRQMIKASLEDQVRAESARLVEEMAEIIKSGRKVQVKTAQQYIERIRNLARMVKEYKDMLEEKSITAESALELAQAQAMTLLNTAEAA